MTEFDRKFELLNRVVRPCQWNYRNAYEDGQGYHLEYAMSHPREFNRLFEDYLSELSEEDPSVKNKPLKNHLSEIWDDVNVAAYVVFVEGMVAGLFVSSVPDNKVNAGEAETYMQEIYVCPKFRHRGIEKDIFLRFIGQQKAATGFRITSGNPR